jgi:aspartyl-tRNA(Asn)/glutamyl-tRNA(Gln) amidotransferase subunit B
MNRLGLSQLDNDSEIEKAILKVISDNPQQHQEYQQGKTPLIQFFIGKVMAETKGKANPEKVKKILEEKLK